MYRSSVYNWRIIDKVDVAPSPFGGLMFGEVSDEAKDVVEDEITSSSVDVPGWAI